jgi:hypothetical protein
MKPPQFHNVFMTKTQFTCGKLWLVAAAGLLLEKSACDSRRRCPIE